MLAMCVPAWAGRNGGGSGGGGGGGRLGQVTGGLGGAKSSPSSSSDSSSNGSSSESSSNDSDSDSSSDYSYTYSDSSASSVCEDCSANSAPSIRAPIVWPAVSAHGFAGAQKVYESDGSISAELSLVFNGRFRLNAAATRYFEREMTITMAMPSLTAGIQLTQSPTTRLWVEGGVVHVGTKDPFSDPVSMLGSMANVRLEHDFNKNIALIASAGAMLFSDVQAFGGRGALRIHHVEVGVRYLEFLELPALYGPEIGIGF
jgi:hypothetical protein